MSDVSQNIEGNNNQTFGTADRSIIVYVSGNSGHVSIDRSTLESLPKPPSQNNEIGESPYQGLLSFQENDRHNFFGRSRDIENLSKKFQNLQAASVRLLTVYGSSGSGKSSLARAGLIPELAHNPSLLPGKEKARVVVMVPGTEPLQALAVVLARIATNDSTPVSKSREFADELARKNSDGEFDGLQRIANALPDIATVPLIILIDQFEEVYSLCKKDSDRDEAIANLIYAASDKSGYVSVILVMRSDFLSKTQKHPQLDRLFSEQGFLVPTMDAECLRAAIVKPADRAGYTFDRGTVDLLIHQTQERDGALPLLQFALEEIWKEIKGKQPAQTLAEIGGVGGALAGKAHQIYQSLSPDDRQIAQRVFLRLVQLGEGAKDTRRRANISDCVSQQSNLEKVKKVIDRFATPDRLITLAANGNTETAEVTHEALFDCWQELKSWIEENRDDLRFHRRLDEAAKNWEKHQRLEGSLWRYPDLDLLKKYHERAVSDMTLLQVEFFNAAVKFEETQKQQAARARWLRRFVFGLVSAGFVMTSASTLFANRQSQIANIERNASSARELLPRSPLDALIAAIESGQELEKLVDPKSSPGEYPSIHPVLALQTILDRLDEIQLLNQIETSQKGVNTIAFDRELKLMATAGGDGKVKLWNKLGKEYQEFSVYPETTKVNSVRFSPHDGNMIATGGENGVAKILNIKNGTVLHEIPAHPGSGVRNIRFGNSEPNLIVTSGHDGKIKLWNQEGKLQKELKDPKLDRAHNSGIEAVTLSKDDKLLITVSQDKTAKIWSRDGTLKATLRGHKNTVKSAKFVNFPQNEIKIITAGHDDVVKIWNLHGNLELTIPPSKFAGQGGINSVEYYENSLITAGNNGTVKRWDLKGNLLVSIQAHKGRIETIRVNEDTLTTAGQEDGIVKTWDLANRSNQSRIILKGHTKSVNSIRFSPDKQKIITASSDGTAKLWDFQGQQIGSFSSSELAGIESVRFINNDTIVTATGEKEVSTSKVKFWDLNGKLLNEFDTNQSGIHSVNIHGDYLSTAGYDKTVKLWNKIDNNNYKYTSYKILPHDRKVGSSRFSPDGKFVAVSGENGLLKIWSIDGKKAWNLPGYSGKVHLGFSPTGELATVGNDRYMRIWSLDSIDQLKPIKTIDTSLGSFQGVYFSPDGKMIVTTTEKGEVQFWTLSGQKLAQFKIHDRLIRSGDFSNDGLWFATASEDGLASISRVSNLSDLLDRGCNLLKDYLATHPDDAKRLPRCRPQNLRPKSRE